jgi:hypothetical protein
LPKDTSGVGHLPAGWDEEELQSADRAAEEVVRKVRAGVFWPPASPPPDFCEDFAAICQDGRFGTIVAAEEEGSGGG